MIVKFRLRDIIGVLFLYYTRMPKQTVLIVVVITAIVGLALLIIIYRMNNVASPPISSTSALGELCAGPLVGCVGKMVKISGTKSGMIGQHIGSANQPYFNTSYLDTDDSGQLVVYTKVALNVPDGTKLELIGKVMKVGGDAQPGSYEYENQVPPEYQIAVESWQKIK